MGLASRPGGPKVPPDRDAWEIILIFSTFIFKKALFLSALPKGAWVLVG
jgi:hypothetical protein